MHYGGQTKFLTTIYSEHIAKRRSPICIRVQLETLISNQVDTIGFYEFINSKIKKWLKDFGETGVKNEVNIYNARVLVNPKFF